LAFDALYQLIPLFFGGEIKRILIYGYIRDYCRRDYSKGAALGALPRMA
jgi:hypothetical protein